MCGRVGGTACLLFLALRLTSCRTDPNRRSADCDWPGETVVIGNLVNKVTSAKLLATSQPVIFEQDDFRVRLTGLPRRAPQLVTTIVLECDGEPKQDNENKRGQKPREGKY